MVVHQATAVYFSFNARDASRLRVLPHDVVDFLAKDGWFGLVFGNHPVIALKLTDKVLVVEILIGIKHRLHPIVSRNFVDKKP